MMRLLLLTVFALGATPALAEPRYAVTLAGLPLMEIELDLVDRGSAYRAAITARADAAGYVARLSGEDADVGRIYRFEIEAEDWRQRTVVETPVGARPQRTDPAPRAGATRAAQGAVDPVMALVGALRAAGEGRCPGDVRVFDGWRNIAVTFTEGAAVGDARVCRFTTDAATSGDDPIDRLLGAGEARFVDAADGRADIESVRIGPALFGLMVRRIAPSPSDTHIFSDQKDLGHDRL